MNIKITAIQSPNAIVYITLSFLYANLTIGPIKNILHKNKEFNSHNFIHVLKDG